LTIEDILTRDTREKCDVFPNYYFVSIKGYEDGDEYQGIKPITVSLLVFKTCILTFHFSKNQYSDAVLKRFQQKQRFGAFISSGLQKLTADFICYSLLDEITDAFLPLVRYLEFDTQSIDDLVALLKASDQSDMLQRINYSRRRLMIVARLINNKPELIKLVLSRMKAQSSDILFYLEDIYDHAITMKQDLHQFDLALGRAHSNYLAQISIEINQVSNKSNNLAAKITTIASVFLPMQVIASIWGYI
jgi:magnesium transporter